MSESKPRYAEIVATVRARAVEYAGRLPAERRDRLAALAGAPARGADEDPAEACVDAVSSAAGTRRLLAAIDRDARDALLYFLCGSDVLDEIVFDGQVREFFGWPKARSRDAIDALFAAGLLGRPPQSAFVLDAFPALRIGLGPDLLVWLAGAGDDAPAVVPFARRLALLLAYAHAAPPTLTAGGALTVRWMERAQEVFAAAGFPSRFLAGCVALLGRAGALAPDPSDPDGKTWRVDARWQEALRSRPDDLALTFADTTEAAPWGTLLGTLALLERARTAGDEHPTITRLSELGKAWIARRSGDFVPYYEGQFRPLAIASALRALRALGLVSLARVEGGVSSTRTPAGDVAPRPFRCTVLPTFEVWVAADADPAGTAELGRIADLSSTDHVAKFTLTQKSVARAASEPGGAATAIERLAAAAEHGLPDNVRMTLEGWSKRATLMRAYRGAVIVAATEEQAVFLRGRAVVVAEISPRVFHVDGDALTELLRTAEKAGHPIAPVAREGRPGSRRDMSIEPIDLGRHAEEVRARLTGWGKPSPSKPPPSKPVPTTAPRPVRDEPVADDPDDLFDVEAEALTPDELRRGWPRVAAAVRAFGPVERVALRLSVEALDRLALLESDAAIRRRIVEHASSLTAADRRPRTVAPDPIRAPVDAPAAESATESMTGPSSDEGPPWLTPTPGALVQLLGGAAHRRQVLDIVYIGTGGTRSEWRILPLELVHAGQRQWLSAKLVSDDVTTRFELDRIAAVRTP